MKKAETIKTFRGRTVEEQRQLRAARRRRQRAAAKERARIAAEQAHLRGEQVVHLNSEGLVAMRLQQPLVVRTSRDEVLTFSATTEVWARPGDVIDLEARGVAARVQEPTFFGVAVITGPPPDRFETEQEEPPKERTAAGY